MRNPTEMMAKILKSDVAQQVSDYVSPLYGDSYVGLWLFEVIGEALDPVVAYAAALKTEGNPLTADLLLPLWEQHYKLPANEALTKEQRQQRIKAKILGRGALNPNVLAEIVSAALGGVRVDIQERYEGDKNTFLVNVREVIPSFEPARAVLSERKPAHLIYVIRVATQTVAGAEIKTAVAITHSQKYRIEVMQ